MATGLAVHVAPGAASLIAPALAATTPGGDAPTAAVIQAAAGYLQSIPDTNAKYILLATDGRSGCATGDGGAGAADTEAENAVATALESGIPTFVLGLAPAGDTTAIATLNQLAVNGGEPSRGSANAFATLGSIDMQLSPIASMTPRSGNPCVAALPYALDPGTVLAISVTTVNGQSVAIPEDPLVGWSFTSPGDDSIYISGEACSGLQSGAYTQIAFNYICTLLPQGDLAR